MDIFGLPQPPYKELALLDGQLELLDKTWSLVADWEAAYAGWKGGLFMHLNVRLRTRGSKACMLRATQCMPQCLHDSCSIGALPAMQRNRCCIGVLRHSQVDEMEAAAGRVTKQVARLGRDAQALPVVGWLRDTLAAFKRTLLLITDLRNAALRPRHWQQLVEHVGTRCVRPRETHSTCALAACRPAAQLHSSCHLSPLYRCCTATVPR